jgi:hypothetical protein
MEGPGLVYQIADDKVLLYCMSGISVLAIGFATYLIKSLNSLTSAITISNKASDARITKLEQIMSSLGEALNAQEQRIRKLELDIILLKAEAIKLTDFKRFEQQMEILGGDKTTKAVAAFVRGEVSRKEDELERLREDLRFGRRSND